MPHVPGRRADQLGHLMLVLELAAVDLHDPAHVSVEHLGQRLHGTGLTRSGRSEEQKNTDRSVLRSESRLMELNTRDDVLQGVGLSNDLARKEPDQLVGSARALDLLAGDLV